MKTILFLLGLVCVFHSCGARRHHLEIRDDIRRYISLSTFGFYQGGILDVKFGNFRVEHGQESGKFGMSLDRTLTDAMNPYLDGHQDQCILEEKVNAQHNGPIMFFTMDLKNKKVHIDCSDNWQEVYIYKTKEDIPAGAKQPAFDYFAPNRRKRSITPEATPLGSSADTLNCNQIELPMVTEEKDGYLYYTTRFVMWIPTKKEEGLYNLYFHACPNYQSKNAVDLHFDVDIEESNGENFLSAGEMPLPALYCMMSILFFLSGLFWVFILNKSRHPVFKIHYIMAVLVFLKSLSLMFHSINFHFIEVRGEHVEAWAILFYITHLLKGAVLFITIVLIGTGWTFIKHILADRDKQIFMIVIPLQILANVAEIIIAESEEGEKEHQTWRMIFTLVDLICCGAIMFPVVWSIRHLQEASATDGKAATNLRKLKLFRQFYIMIVCYIYVTRIIVYLLLITTAFQYSWVDEMFKEMATYVFFVLTGYKFRPTTSHPYFDDESDNDEYEDKAITESGLMKGAHNMKVTNRMAPPSLATSNSSTVLVESGDDEEQEALISKRESSHDYD